MPRSIIQLGFFIAVVASTPLLLRFGKEREIATSERAFSTELEAERAHVIRKDPAVVFVGNSMLFSRLISRQFRDLSGRKNVFLDHPGSASACWYLYLKNIVAPTGIQPEKVIVFFRDQALTWPEFRTTGQYVPYIESLRTDDEPILDAVLNQSAQSSIGGLLAGAITSGFGINGQPDRFQSVLRDLSLDLTAFGSEKHARRLYMNARFAFDNLRHDLAPDDAAKVSARKSDTTPQQFSPSPAHSFLPHMLDVADQIGTELCFYRVKKRCDVENTRPPTPYLPRYLRDLQSYIESRGAQFIDETNDSIPPEWYADGDHIAKERRPEYTDFFWSKVEEAFETAP